MIIIIDNNIDTKPVQNKYFRRFLFFSLSPILLPNSAPAPNRAKGAAAQIPQNSSFVVISLFYIEIKKIMFSKNIEHKYTSEFLAFIIILVHVLQNLKITGKFSCSNTIISNIYSNFFHVDLFHLLINVYGIYYFSNLEKKIGTKKFCFLILFLLITTAFFETALKTIFPTIKCSVGFSGIIFGMATFVKTIHEEDSKKFIKMIALEIIYNFSHKNSISISSHIIGILCGIISGLLFSKFNFLFL